LDYNQAVQMVDRIITAKSIIEHNGKIFVVKDPGPFERQMGEFYYNNELKKLIDADVPSYEEMTKIYEDQGYLVKTHKKFNEIYKKQLLELNKELPALKFQSLELNKVKDKIRSLERQNNNLKKIYSDISSKSAEHVANILKHKYFVYALTDDENGKRIWNCTFEEFLVMPDKLPGYILGNSFYPQNITEKEIRYLARNEPWRSSWVTATKMGNLIDRPISCITDLQKALFTWSTIYDNAFECYEPPSDDIVNNDDLFDAWMAAKSEERKRERDKKQIDSMLPKGSSKPSQRTNVGIIVETEEDARRVFATNDPVARMRIQRDESAIAKGVTEDAKLPQNQELMKEILYARK